MKSVLEGFGAVLRLLPQLFILAIPIYILYSAAVAVISLVEFSPYFALLLMPLGVLFGVLWFTAKNLREQKNNGDNQKDRQDTYQEFQKLLEKRIAGDKTIDKETLSGTLCGIIQAPQLGPNQISILVVYLHRFINDMVTGERCNNDVEESLRKAIGVFLQEDPFYDVPENEREVILDIRNLSSGCDRHDVILEKLKRLAVSVKERDQKLKRAEGAEGKAIKYALIGIGHCCPNV